MMADPFSNIRDEARTRATQTLRERGFMCDSDGNFSGALTKGDQSVAVHLSFPPKFPDEPLIVTVDDPTAISRRAHIEQNGKLCLFPNTGLLIDTTRPKQIILDSLERASDVLFGAEDDYKTEFLAYWRHLHTPQILSIVSDFDKAHALAATTAGNFLVFGDNASSLHEWLRRVGWPNAKQHNAFMVPLRELPDAPPIGSNSKLRAMLKIVQNYASESDRKAFELWLKNLGLPAYLVLSAPDISGTGKIVFAAELLRAEGKAAGRVHKGFRIGTLPPSLEVVRSKDQPVIRFAPQRVDAEYLVSRVGGDTEFFRSSIMVVGCGSLGSQIAENLAASGVGTLTLVDNDELSADNVHRHVLGMSQIGENKTIALRDHLLGRLPHLNLVSIPEDIEEVFSNQPDLFHEHELIIFALGDETLERRLNRSFPSSTRRIHGWLEPLGVGGHALLTGNSACFGCVFDRDEAGLHNLTSLVGREQDFLRSIGGCSGAFTPFGFVDAAQGAVEVTRLALEVLRNKNMGPRLISWAGSADQFRSGGYKLSKRGELVHAEQRIVNTSFDRRDCEACLDK